MIPPDLEASAVIQYVAGSKYLERAGELTDDSLARFDQAKRMLAYALGGVAVLAVFVWWLFSSGKVTLVEFADWTGIILLGMVVIYFAYTLAFAVCDRE